MLAIVCDEILQLLAPPLLLFNNLFRLPMDTIVSVQLLLQLNNCLVALVKTTCQPAEDVTVLPEDVLVVLNLLLVFFNLLAFTLNLRQFPLVLLPNQARLLL